MATSDSSHEKNEHPDLHLSGRSSGGSSGRAPSTPLSAWAQRLAPNLDVVSASSPEPNVEPGTIVAVFTDPADARELVLSWERLEAADQSVGFVALGTALQDEMAYDGSATSAPDPEGVMKDAAQRAVIGALIGAVVGFAVALVFGVATGWGSGVIAALIGVPALGAMAGAAVVFVLRSGWGEGYMQSYVDPEATALAVCAIAVRDEDHRGPAVAAARDADARQVLVVDADGRASDAYA